MGYIATNARITSQGLSYWTASDYSGFLTQTQNLTGLKDLLGKVTPKVSLGTADFLIAGRDLQISAFRAPIFRSATGI